MEKAKKCMLIIIVSVVALGTFYFVMMPLIGELRKKENEIKRDVYETNPQYIKGKADDIAKYMYEYNTTNDKSEKSAICQVVNQRFADFDLNDLNDVDLINFVRSCKIGGN